MLSGQPTTRESEAGRRQHPLPRVCHTSSEADVSRIKWRRTTAQPVRSIKAAQSRKDSRVS
jgi:hypothetical protein